MFTGLELIFTVREHKFKPRKHKFKDHKHKILHCPGYYFSTCLKKSYYRLDLKKSCISWRQSASRMPVVTVALGWKALGARR